MTDPKPSIPIAKLRELLHYEPSTGTLTWKVRRSRIPAGSIADHVNRQGYIKVSLCNTSQLGHRIAWALFYGVWPDQWIDHRNDNPLDNRIENLRLAGAQENAVNRRKATGRSSVFIGVTWHRKCSKWQATIRSHGRMRYLGLFKEERDAARAYNDAAAIYHGEFARLNVLGEGS